MEFSSSLSRGCHAAGRKVEPGLFGTYSLVPVDRAERMRSYALGVSGAAAFFGIPATIAALHLGGLI